MSMPSRKVLWIFIAVAVGLALVSSAYILNMYESPEDCFVREMAEWAEKENLTEKVQSMMSEKDSEMIVSRAKTILDEYNISNVSGDNKKIYLRSATLFEYCNVK